MDRKKIVTGIVFIGILIVISFLLWYSPKQCPYTSGDTGFSWVRPMEPSKYLLTDGTFGATFVNSENVPIRITKIELIYQGADYCQYNQTCRIVKPTGSITLNGSGVFELIATCPEMNQREDELALLYARLYCEKTVNGDRRTAISQGAIRLLVEGKV